MLGQQGNDHTKFRHQPDCLNVTEVSYMRELLTLKHEKLMSVTLPVLSRSPIPTRSKTGTILCPSN